MINKIWLYISGAFALILGLFFYERKQKEDSQSQVALASNTTYNAVTKTKVEALNQNIEEAKKATEEKKSENTSKDDLLTWLNKK